MECQRRHTLTDRAPPISEDAWILQKATIRNLYIDQGLTLDEVMGIMHAEYAFHPTKRQYTLRLAKWGFWKKHSRCRSQLTQASSSTDTTASTPYTFNTVSIQQPGAEPIHAVADTRYDITAPPDVLASIQNGNATTQQHKASESFPGRETSLAEWNFAAETPCSGTDHTLPDQTLFDDSLSQVQDRPLNDPLYIIEEEGPDTVSFDFRDAMTPDLMTNDSSSFSATEKSGAGPLDEQDGSAHDEAWPQLAGSGSEIPSADPMQPGEGFINDITLSPGIQTETLSCCATDGTLPPGCQYFSLPNSIELDPPLIVVNFSTVINLPDVLSVQCRLPHRDLAELRKVAELLSAARSTTDAFRLNYLIFSQISAHSKTHWNSSLMLAAAEVCRNATTSADNKTLSNLVKRHVSGHAEFHPPTTLDACLLHSYLGNTFRTSVRKDLRSAERHCRLALHSYYSLLQNPKVKGRPAYETILVSNLVHVLTEKGDRNAFSAVKAAYFPNRSVAGVEMTGPETMADHVARMVAVNKAAASRPSVDVSGSLFSLLEWCTNVLADEDFWLMWGDVDTPLRISRKDECELADLDSTILFCYLWSRWDRELHVEVHPGLTRHSRVHLNDIEIMYGIRPADTLSAISKIILREPYYGARQHPNLAGRALRNCRKLSDARSPSMTEELLHVHASLLRNPIPNTRRSGNHEIPSLAEDFVRLFIKSHVTIKLSENAFLDPRLRPILGRASFSPSITPTMLSTPRSSLSGFRSFKSAGRRSIAFLAGKSTETMSLATDSVRDSTTSSSFFRRSSRTSWAMSVDPIWNDGDVVMTD